MLARVLIPAGYMPMAGQTMALTVCTGVGMQTIAVPIERHDGKSDRHGSSSTDDVHPCAYAGMGLLATGAADAPLLVAALLLVFLKARSPVNPLRLATVAFLRPPLRAPPTPA